MVGVGIGRDGSGDGAGSGFGAAARFGPKVIGTFYPRALESAYFYWIRIWELVTG